MSCCKGSIAAASCCRLLEGEGRGVLLLLLVGEQAAILLFGLKG